MSPPPPPWLSRSRRMAEYPGICGVLVPGRSFVSCIRTISKLSARRRSSNSPDFVVRPSAFHCMILRDLLDLHPVDPPAVVSVAVPPLVTVKSCRTRAHGSQCHCCGRMAISALLNPEHLLPLWKGERHASQVIGVISARIVLWQVLHLGLLHLFVAVVSLEMAVVGGGR